MLVKEHLVLIKLNAIQIKVVVFSRVVFVVMVVHLLVTIKEKIELLLIVNSLKDLLKLEIQIYFLLLLTRNPKPVTNKVLLIY